MAFVNQERKAILAAELKKVMPRDWKYSLSVHHHSTIVLTISAAPVDLIAEYNKHVSKQYERRGDTFQPHTDHVQLNVYHLDGQFSGDLLTTFERINDALHVGNHDRSDIQSDYFDVGWYVDINIGRWNKPFTVCAPSGKPEPKPIKTAPSCPTITAKNESELLSLIKKHDIFQNPPLMIPASDLANCWVLPRAEC